MHCTNCNADLVDNHILECHDVPAMSNKSRILHPRCSLCGRPISPADVSRNINPSQKVLLITGTAGAGKTALGQLIESRSRFIFVDGDTVQKKLNHFAKQGLSSKTTGNSCQRETISTMLTLLGLGYDVVVGYIIDHQTLPLYEAELAQYNITPVFRVLIPDRSVCLQRDLDRDCWTAGPKWVDLWHEEMQSFAYTHSPCCIDSSRESLEETFARFIDLL